jgi:flagellum-specific peptidoglycan hydrolase FlgJ
LQFLLRVAPGALESERVYQVPACITLAQAILESATSAGWGASSLFRLANNPFGIKFSYRALEPSHNDPVLGSAGLPIPDPYGAFDAQTWEIENGQKKVMIAQFQRFPNLTEAFRAHAQLLCSPRYRPAFAVRLDWKRFAERLGPKTSPLDSEHCGYSTNPSYSAELIKLVELYRLNDPRAVEWFATGQDPEDGASTDPIIGSLKPGGPEDEPVKRAHCSS